MAPREPRVQDTPLPQQHPISCCSQRLSQVGINSSYPSSRKPWTRRRRRTRAAPIWRSWTRRCTPSASRWTSSPRRGSPAASSSRPPAASRSRCCTAACRRWWRRRWRAWARTWRRASAASPACSSASTTSAAPPPATPSSRRPSPSTSAGQPRCGRSNCGRWSRQRERRDLKSLSPGSRCCVTCHCRKSTRTLEMLLGNTPNCKGKTQMSSILVESVLMTLMMM